jgi:hypothetical protein
MSGQVLRLALVLEHMQWAAGDHDWPPQSVSLRSVSGAIELIDYFKAMLVRALGETNISQGERGATALARAIVARPGLETINLREVRRGWGIPGLSTRGALEAAAGELEEAGWLTLVRPAGRGRPSTDWTVNPLVYGQSPG